MEHPLKEMCFFNFFNLNNNDINLIADRNPKKMVCIHQGLKLRLSVKRCLERKCQIIILFYPGILKMKF